MTPQHEAARAYAKRGWPVFPVRPRGKEPLTEHGCKDATCDVDTIATWWEKWPTANIALATGHAFDVLDLDSSDAAVAFRGWCEQHGIEPLDLRRAVVRTSNGWHYYVAPTGVGNRARLLGAAIDWRGVGGYVVAPPSIHPSGHTYDWVVAPNGTLPAIPDAWRDVLAPPRPPRTAAEPALAKTRMHDTPPDAYVIAAYEAEIAAMRDAREGNRNDTLFRTASNLAEFVNGGYLPDTVLDELASIARAGGLPDLEIDRTLRSALQKTAGTVRDIPQRPAAPVEGRRTPPRPVTADPRPDLRGSAADEPTVRLTVEPAAWHGLAGEITRSLDPWTEAHPVAVLASLLAGIGVCIGSGPHAVVSTTRHPLLIWPLLLGSTSTGRKGTAQDVAEAILTAADPGFTTGNITGGLSSGEGLIHLVRDPKWTESGGDGEPKLTDPGVDDKRRLIIETEYGGTMARSKRDGSSLPAVLRQAWDGKTLAVLTKTSVTSTGAHIGIAAHVTPGEFMRRLRDEDLLGGTYNRFLPLLVHRSKVLPHAPAPPAEMIADYGFRLRAVMSHARTLHAIARTAPAARAWEGLYAELSARGEGDDRLGSFVARCVPYAVRIAALYAVIDGSPVVEPEHLEAAAALVRYSIASMEALLTSPEDARLQRLTAALVDAGDAGLTRTDVHRVFHRCLTASEIDALLERVPGLDVVRAMTGGRPETRYVLARE